MKITFAKPSTPSRGAAAILSLKGGKLTPSGQGLDKALKGALKRAIAAARFKGDKAKTLDVVAPGGGAMDRVLVIGLGEAAEVDALRLQDAGGALYKALSGEEAVAVLVDALPKGKLAASEMAAHVAYGARLASYRFDKYRTAPNGDNDGKPQLKALTVQSAEFTKARGTFAPLGRVADGVFFTRDLVSEPPNVIYPKTLADQCWSLTKLGVKVTVLGRAQMKKLGMNALLGVAQGSAYEPQLVCMEWKGATAGRGRGAGPVALVGKGVTFDTGGISLKPAGGMWDMKWDMGGAGAVIGAMKALAGRKAKAHVVGVVGLVENMPDGKAQRPGDIVTAMSGTTIEVLNTDAEGRLVLADALWYAMKTYKPRVMVNLATLTGAIIVSLGHEYAGLFSNNDACRRTCSTPGGRRTSFCGACPWRMSYDKKIKDGPADLKNISAGRDAGSIVAAQFLQHFVGDTPWAHLDIAGVAWSSKAKPTVPKGGTAYGVRLLDRLVADYYEGK